MLIHIQTFQFKNMHIKIPSAKCRIFCSSYHVLVLWRKSDFNCNEGLCSNSRQRKKIVVTVQIIGTQGVIAEFKFVENSAFTTTNSIKVIATVCCIWCSAYAVVIFTKLCSNLIAGKWHRNKFPIKLNYGCNIATEETRGPQIILFKNTH